MACDEKKGLVIEEFINGVTLEEYLQKNGILKEEQVCSMIHDLCDALFSIHNMGIVHRDIKPENIMLSGDGVIKVIDFGIARIVKDRQGQDTMILGTVGYAAPEQCGYRQTDARADIYAVGVLINRLLTGEMPTQYLYSVPPMNNVIRRCIEIDARNRFQTIQELKNTLQSIARMKTQANGKIALNGQNGGSSQAEYNIKSPYVEAVKTKAEEKFSPDNLQISEKVKRNYNWKPGCVIKGVPGFRTGVLWKNVVGTLIYVFFLITICLDERLYLFD